MTFILAAAIFWSVLVGLVLWAGWHDMHESPTQKGKSS